MSKMSGNSWKGIPYRNDPSLLELYQLKYDVVSDLYRRRARAIEATKVKELLNNPDGPRSARWEYYAYRLFGSHLLGSIAFTLDPYWQVVDIGKKEFGVPKKLLDTLNPVTVVPVNRVRKFPTILAGQTLFKESKVSVNCGNSVSWNGHFYEDHGMACTTGTVNSSLTGTLPAQGVVYGFIKDTTWKSRNPNVKVDRFAISQQLLNSQGEYEKFIPRLANDATSWGGLKSQDAYDTKFPIAGTDFWLRIRNRTTVTGHSTGPSIVITDASAQSYAASEKTYAQTIMAKNLDSLMAQCVPNRREFNLAYQIGELKDTLQMCKASLQTWVDVQRLMGKDAFTKALYEQEWWNEINVYQNRGALSRVLDRTAMLDKSAANLYLNFKFGFQSLYQALRQLLDKPESVAKDMNYLIRNNGRFANLSSTRSWTEKIASPPTLSLPNTSGYLVPDSAYPAETWGYRKIDLRCCVNTGINFPAADVPSLRWKTFLDKLGFRPTASDLYDLIPWTWLYDWFSGTTQYVHLLDRLNGDKSLINYGFITYKSVGTVFGSRRLFGTSTYSMRSIPPSSASDPVWQEIVKWSHEFTGRVELSYELRLSIASLINVKTYSGLNLSGDQKTIIGALLSAYL